MSFDDHVTARPTAQQTKRCKPEVIQDARRTCERYVRRKGDSDVALLADLIEMLGLGEDAVEKLSEDVAEAS